VMLIFCVLIRNSLGIFFGCNYIQPMTTNGIKKVAKNFQCEACDFVCSKQYNYDKHLATRKHINTTKHNEIQPKKEQIKEYTCECGKFYNHRASLFNHKKSCTYEPVPEPEPEKPKKHKLYEKDNLVEVLLEEHIYLKKENSDFKTMILDLVKTNTDLQKQMLEVCKNGMGGSHNNHNHSHNKTFNMQVFLNEKCKDAMNIMDFVNTMTLDFADLEEVGKVGYVEGIGGIIIKKLNELDVYKRPIHCSDAKREIMYVKDENVWGKENSTYDKLRKAIKHVTFKNSSMLEPWSKANPQCMNTSHRLNDVYVQMIGQSMGGKESFLDSENKIMKKIAKAVLIDKALL
jgi:hypothetical protein